jgi:UDP-glucose 4-epimerase
MIHCLVTGGAGFIGSHIVQSLIDRGDKVRVLDNLSTGHLRNIAGVSDHIDFIEGDLRDEAIVARAVRDVEIIFHEAALASVPRSVALPLDTHAHCVTGTLVLLDAARKANVRRIVYAGSSSAYGNLPFSSKREMDSPTPLSPYAAAKLAGEFYCQAFFQTYGLETVCLRYFNVFGPRQDPFSPYSAVIPLFIAKLLRGERPIIFGDGMQSRDFTYVENVVSANLKAAEAPGAAGMTFNIGTGRSVGLLVVLEQLQRFLGTKILPQLESPRVGDVRDSLADICLAGRVLGYEPHVDLEQGLRKTVDFYRESVKVLASARNM